MKYTTALSLLIMQVTLIHAAPIILSDPKITSQSFPFSIKAHAFNENTGILLVGAQEAVEENAFTLAWARSFDMQFWPLAPANVIMNGQKDITNPLRNTAINFAAFLNNMPAVVTAKQPNMLYLVSNFPDTHTVALIQSEPLRDMHGKTSAAIAGIGSSVSYHEGVSLSGIYVALKNEAGSFGAPGSCLALLQLHQVTHNGITKILLEQTKSYALDITTQALAIGNAVASIDNDLCQEPVSIHFDPINHVMYAGMLITAGAQPTDGARALLVNGTTASAPESAFEADSIVGGIGPSLQISIHQIKTMFTSTSLSYLIIQGGVGSPSHTKKMLYALPIVTDPEGDIGVLARKDAMPREIYDDYPPYKFKARIITDPALNPGDLYTPQSQAARIGGNGYLPGDIQECIIMGDSVYVASVATDQQLGGIYYSRALFDTYGRIKDWTDWQRAGSRGNFFGLALASTTAGFWLLEKSDQDHVCTIRRTQWGEDPQHDGQIVNSFLTPDNYGVQGMVDIPWGNSSVALFTGNNRVCMIQSSSENIKESFGNNQGALHNFMPPYYSLSISGGKLEKLGALTTAALAHDHLQSWLVVGGSNGLAVLAHPDGTGFKLALDAGFKGLDATLSFMTLGNYARVKKVIAIDNILYIMTEQKLFKLVLSSENIISPQDITLAHIKQLNCANFNDLIVSGDLALLATNNGLWRIGNGASIRSAKSFDECCWKNIELNEFAGAVTKLYGYSPTILEADVATARSGGMVDVLAASLAYHQSRIYRLTLQPGTITEDTVQQLPDFFVENIKTFYINVGSYRNGLFTDGGLYLFTNSRYNPKEKSLPKIYAVSAKNRLLERSDAVFSSVKQSINAPLSIHSIMRRLGDGTLVMATDQGIRING